MLRSVALIGLVACGQAPPPAQPANTTPPDSEPAPVPPRCVPFDEIPQLAHVPPENAIEVKPRALAEPATYVAVGSETELPFAVENGEFEPHLVPGEIATLLDVKKTAKGSTVNPPASFDGLAHAVGKATASGSENHLLIFGPAGTANAARFLDVYADSWRTPDVLRATNAGPADELGINAVALFNRDLDGDGRPELIIYGIVHAFGSGGFTHTLGIVDGRGDRTGTIAMPTGDVWWYPVLRVVPPEQNGGDPLIVFVERHEESLRLWAYSWTAAGFSVHTDAEREGRLTGCVLGSPDQPAVLRLTAEAGAAPPSS